MKIHPSPIVSTNHHSLRDALRYTPPCPDHNRFAGLAIGQELAVALNQNSGLGPSQKNNNRPLAEARILVSGRGQINEEPECTQAYMRIPSLFLTNPETKRQSLCKRSNHSLDDTGDYTSFSSYAGYSSSSEEDTPLPSTPSPFPSLKKRQATPFAPPTPFSLRASSNQVPTPEVARESTQPPPSNTTSLANLPTVWSFIHHQYPELNALQAKGGSCGGMSPSVSPRAESEGSSSDDYGDTLGLYGAW